MKTRKRKAVAPDMLVADSTAEISQAQSAPEASADKPDRISFYVGADGAPEWDRISPSTKEKLTSILQNAKVQKELGFNKEQAEAISKIGFDETEANALLDALSGIDSTAASMIYKIPGSVTSEAFAFTPDHRKKINPPLVRVLNKWGPAMLKTWKDEIGLAIVFFAVLNSQVRLMHILEEKRKRNLPREDKKATVTTIKEAVAEKKVPETSWPEDTPAEKTN